MHLKTMVKAERQAKYGGTSSGRRASTRDRAGRRLTSPRCRLTCGFGRALRARFAPPLIAALWLVAMSCAPGADLQLGPASLSVSGQDSFTLRTQHISGAEASRSSYRWENYALSRGVEHNTDLIVRGALLPNLLVDAAIARGPYMTGRQRLTFTFDGSDALVRVGDLAVAFDGIELLRFCRSLRGIEVETKLPRGALTMLASESKPALRTDLLYGRNSAGPYYLAASPLVDASEVVEVDGRHMVRGSDYSIDYQIGLIQFAPSFIISPTSRIVVTYEYDAPGGMSGSLVGLRALFPVTPALRVGATYFGLDRRAATTPVSAVKEDRWLGNNSAGPFTLSYRPIEPGSEHIRVDGIIQVAGRDYRIDYITGAIVFLQPLPAGVSVVVTYRVSGAAQSGAPQRAVTGIDAHYAAGRHLNLSAEFAHSNSGLGTAGSGRAVVFGARGDWDRLHLSANLRSAGAAFNPIESTSAPQERRGYDLGLDFEPAQGLRLAASTRDYLRPYLQFGGASDLFVRDRTREIKLDFRHPGWPSLSYAGTWSSLSGQRAQSLVERSGDQLINIGYERGAFGFKAGYRRNSYARQGESPLAQDTAPSYTLPALDSFAYSSAYSGRGAGSSLSMWYRPGDRLNIICDLARSGMALVGGGTTRAGSARLGVEYAPSSKTSISLGLRSSSSGQAVCADGRPVPGYVSHSQTINVRQNLTSNLALNLAYDSQLNEGGYGADVATDAWTGGFWWQPGKALSLIGQYTRQNLAYLGASGRSANEISSLGATISPFGGGLKLDLSFSHMSGSASGSFGSSYGSAYEPVAAEPITDTYGYGASGVIAAHGMANSSLRARITYPVANRQEAFAEWETSSNSGYPGGDRHTAMGIGWRISLTRELSFTVDWRRIASASADSQYSYRAQTLGAQLGAKF
jgi:hypothetical protein